MLTADARFAHRGLHDATKPRNSLPAMVAAAEAGYGVEFDLHLAADGVPIVSHDPDTLHDTGVLHQIERTPSSRLRELRFTGTDIPLITLDELLGALSPEVPLLVELKPTSRPRALVDAVAGRLRGREERCAVQSFQPDIVWWSRHRHPQFLAGQLVEPAEAGMTLLQRWHSRTLSSNLVVQPQFLAVEQSMVDSRMVRWWLRRLHCPLLAWTVTTPQAAAVCTQAGAGLIFEGFRP